MADQKISELTALTGADVADTDLLPIVDTSATETKKITFAEFKTALDTATGFVRITGDTMTGALDVQSTITADGLTVENTSGATLNVNTGLAGADSKILLHEGSTVSPANGASIRYAGATNEFSIGVGSSVDTKRLSIARDTGDISFYEDTGTTAKMVWSASDEKLTLSGTGGIDVTGTVTADGLTTNTAGTSNFIAGVNAGNSIIAGGDYNVVVGDEAGTAITTGDNNVAVGFGALKTLATSSQNTAVGHTALKFNTAANNSAFGYGALTANTTGTANLAVGRSALATNTTASNNTAVGYQAGYSNTTGGTNTAVGHQALYTKITGDSNTAVGSQALYSQTSGNENTAVGQVAMYFNITGTTNAAFGRAALYQNTTGASNTASGYGALQNNTTADSNTAVGYQAGYTNTVGFGHTFIGFQAGYSTSTAILARITAVGAYSLHSNTTGLSNVAVGFGAMIDSTTGSYNTALGFDALANNTTASSNTAVGYQAGYSNTTGNDNTFVGYQSGQVNSSGVDQTMVGYRSGYGTTTGDGNTFLGRFAGYSNTTGSGNVFVGYRADGEYGAGHLVTTGSKNTILGGYNGNQGGLDIRTSDNNIVVSDGDGNPRMSCDSTGAVTMPYQPAFSAVPAAAQSNIAINTVVTVVFGTERFDVGANFASNTFTAPVTGKYSLHAHLRLENVDSAANYYMLRITTSNEEYQSLFTATSLSADAQYWPIAMNCLADMDASDTAVVTIYQSAGTSQTDIQAESYFNGILVA
jgi:hypothetical protein